MANGGVMQPVGKTGSATVNKQGHTTDGQHGSNPNAKVKGRGTVQDLHVPSKRS